MNDAIRLYESAYQQHGPTLEALFLPKGRQEDRFGVLTKMISKGQFSVLDFGCGLAHLKDHLSEKFSGFKYTGVDMIPAFVEECSKRHPDSTFHLIRNFEEVRAEYDYIVLSGVFNVLYGGDAYNQSEIVRETLRYLFTRTRRALSCDFMTDQVDFRQANAYHENVGSIFEFASRNLSRRIEINQTYMPYEFSLIIYKNDQIIRPDNVFERI